MQMQGKASSAVSGSMFGCRQVVTWYPSSHAVTHDFERVGQTFPFLPNRYPLYDWIMGFYERWSNRQLLAMTPLEHANTILELGTGTGYLLGEVIRRTHGAQQVTAVDLSQQMLAVTGAYLAAHALDGERTCLEKADCLCLPYADASFDLCISSYLLDLLPAEEITVALTEIARVLKPDGHACLLTMTTEFDHCTWARKLIGSLCNELYCWGYSGGRWNPIWQRLCAGYAPHCRPIALGQYLQAISNLAILGTRITHVLSLPARIYHVQNRR